MRKNIFGDTGIKKRLSTTITLLRHAPLPRAYHGRYNGWSDIPIDPLLFDHQKVKALKEEHFDLIYSSDLIRCTQTIKLLFDGRLKPYPTGALREVKFREEIEGKSFEEIEQLASFNPAYLHDETSWHGYICEESQDAFYQRLRDFLGSLPEDKNILICSHGGAIKAMLYLLGEPAVSLGYLESVSIRTPRNII